MICPKCGAGSIEDTFFCKECGEELIPEEREEPQHDVYECYSCGAEVSEEDEICTACGEVLKEEEVEFARDSSLKSVYKAPDEFLAITIQSVLRKNGIQATIKSRQIAMYNSIGMMMNSVWGEVLVLDSDYERATSIVKEYLSSVEEE